MSQLALLRGATRPEGAASPPLSFLVRRAGDGAAPPASRVLRIALARDSPAGCPIRGDLGGPGGRKPGRPGPAPAARGANPRGGGRTRAPERRETD